MLIKLDVLFKAKFENGLYAKGQLNSGSYLLYYFLHKSPESPKKLQKISGQKSLQYFRCYFGKSMSS